MSNRKTNVQHLNTIYTFHRRHLTNTPQPFSMLGHVVIDGRRIEGFAQFSYPTFLNTKGEAEYSFYPLPTREQSELRILPTAPMKDSV